MAWVTPAKPAAGIPSERIPASQTQGRRSISVSGNTYHLTISDVTVNDGGDYICEGSVNRAIFTLEVDCKCDFTPPDLLVPLSRLGLVREQQVALGKRDLLG